MRRRRSRLRFRIVAFFIGLLLFVTGAVIGLWKTDIALVRAIDVEGAEVIDVQYVEESAALALREPFVGPLSGNFLVLPKARIADRLKRDFPRIETLAVDRNIRSRTLSLRLTERKQAGIYCSAQKSAGPESAPAQALEGQEIVQELVVGACSLIDRNGVIFAEAPETEGGLILAIVEVRGDFPALGMQAMSSERFAAVKDLWETFRGEIRVGLKRILLEDGETLAVETSEGWEALFDLSGDVRAQIVALRELLAKELTPSKRVGIVTIDLRIPGKIYYR